MRDCVFISWCGFIGVEDDILPFTLYRLVEMAVLPDYQSYQVGFASAYVATEVTGERHATNSLTFPLDYNITYT